MILNWYTYLESVGHIPISDIESYIQGMELGYIDKLFFIDKITPDVIVDFGCADGTILSKVRLLNPNIKLIGYDLDKNMLSSAKSKLGKSSLVTDDWEIVKKELKKYKNPALLLSSVIHEVYSYSNSLTIKKFWSEQVFGGDFKWICIRDMIPSTEMFKHSLKNFLGDVIKVKKKYKSWGTSIGEHGEINTSTTNYLKSFEDRWGKISNNYRTFIHFLLKYKYTDNWEREVNENYVPVTLETLYKKIPSNYKIIYQDNFILPSLQEQVKKDFNIKIDHTTHTKMIIENKRFTKN